MTSTSLNPYIYRPLPTNAQTRIIELQPCAAGDDSPPSCRLRDFDVFGHEAYEAVSYTWGEPLFTERVVDDAYFLMTTVNFRDALLRFRLPDRVRLLWVDAVCINQHDEEEKGRQIPFMAQIYSGASRVLVWLGNYPEQAQSLLEVERLARQLQRLPGPAVQHNHAISSGLTSDVLKALQHVFGLPWFTRLWVIQEVVLNPDVLFCCDSAEVPWIRFVQVMRSAGSQSLGPVIPSTIRDLWMLRFFDRDITPRFNTVRLLHDLSSAKCSDDRDKVWALSGLATDFEVGGLEEDSMEESEKLKLQVDYSIGATELYLDLASKMIRMSSTSKPLLLVYAGLRSDGQPPAENLPSWAPDWRLPSIRKPLITSGQEKDLSFLETVNFRYQAIETQPKPRTPAWIPKLRRFRQQPQPQRSVYVG
ncbi:hypothetical protein PG993_014966 [Apiospora rasikravindrae]|uniref:Heterokaryon incompatibility domain-containing protein n=1 Tax=Apiospora rasikravindrae TaxID=990691 RepID=A0ABR1RPL1_9PEZI